MRIQSIFTGSYTDGRLQVFTKKKGGHGYVRTERCLIISSVNTRVFFHYPDSTDKWLKEPGYNFYETPQANVIYALASSPRQAGPLSCWHLNIISFIVVKGRYGRENLRRSNAKQ